MPTFKQALKTEGLVRMRSFGMIIALIVQYLLGMYVNMFAVAPDDPKFKTESIFPKIVFGLHGLVGLLLLLGSIYVFISGYQSEDEALRKMTLYGFLSILLAFSAGIATVVFKDTAAEISSYVMSIGFLLSFISYGRLFFFLKQ